MASWMKQAAALQVSEPGTCGRLAADRSNEMSKRLDGILGVARRSKEC
jgi:hypothetical protein